MSFTPEQIQEILDIYFDVVTKRQYIGARYVPTFGRKDESTTEWDNSAPYEPLTIVTYQGNSYTSRQDVPTGIAITNTDYWVSTGNFNAQVDSYRQDVITLQNSVNAVNALLPASAFDSSNTVQDAILSIEANMDSRTDAIEAALPIADFDSDNTVKGAINAVQDNIEAVDSYFDSVLPTSVYTPENTVKDAIDAESLTRSQADTTLQNNINAEANSRANADNAINTRIDPIVNFLPLNFSTLNRMTDDIIEEGTQTKYGVISVNEVESDLSTPIVWKYRKWESGIAECWGKRLDDFDVVYASGSMYTNIGECRENFPDGLFIDAPEFCNITWSGDYGMLYFGASLASNHTQWYNLMRSTPVLINGYVQVHAIGRWK